MDDLIDRAALLKSMGLTDAVKYGNKTAEQQDRSYSTWMSYEIADAIQDAPAVNRWIPCSERLPKSVGNKVIVFCTGEDVNDYVGFGHYEVFKNTVTWYNLETSLPFADWGLTVTHWMPLPESPKE